jgi:hypothetical protein
MRIESATGHRPIPVASLKNVHFSKIRVRIYQRKRVIWAGNADLVGRCPNTVRLMRSKRTSLSHLNYLNFKRVRISEQFRALSAVPASRLVMFDYILHEPRNFSKCDKTATYYLPNRVGFFIDLGL